MSEQKQIQIIRIYRIILYFNKYIFLDDLFCQIKTIVEMWRTLKQMGCFLWCQIIFLLGSKIKWQGVIYAPSLLAILEE